MNRSVASHVHSGRARVRSRRPPPLFWTDGEGLSIVFVSSSGRPATDRIADATARTSAGWLHPSARRTSARTVALGTVGIEPLGSVREPFRRPFASSRRGKCAVRFASPHVHLASTPGFRPGRVLSRSSSSSRSSSCVTRRSNDRQRASTVVRAVIFAIVSLSGNSDRFVRRWEATLSSLVALATRTLRSEPEPTRGGSEPSRSTRRTRTRPTRHDTVAGRDLSLPSTVFVEEEEEEEAEEEETAKPPSSNKFEEVFQPPRRVHPLSSTKSTSPTSSSTPTHTARRSLALYLALISTRASSRYPRVESPPPPAASFGCAAGAPTTTRSTIAVHVTPLPLNAVVAATTALAAV